MINHNHLLKKLLSNFCVEFLELFFPEVVTYLEKDSICFLDPALLSEMSTLEQDASQLVVQAKFRDQESFFLIYWDNQEQVSKILVSRYFIIFLICISNMAYRYILLLS